MMLKKVQDLAETPHWVEGILRRRRPSNNDAWPARAPEVSPTEQPPTGGAVATLPVLTPSSVLLDRKCRKLQRGARLLHACVLARYLGQG